MFQRKLENDEESIQQPTELTADAPLPICPALPLALSIRSAWAHRTMTTVQYGELSDYFYVGQKRTLSDLYSELFTRRLADKSVEVVANPARNGSAKAAKLIYKDADRTDRHRVPACTQNRRSWRDWRVRLTCWRDDVCPEFARSLKSWLIAMQCSCAGLVNAGQQAQLMHQSMKGTSMDHAAATDACANAQVDDWIAFPSRSVCGSRQSCRVDISVDSNRHLQGSLQDVDDRARLPGDLRR